jgi:hypothetical protein
MSNTNLNTISERTKWIVRDHCLGEIDCRQIEQQLEATDIKNKNCEILNQKDAITIKSKWR